MLRLDALLGWLLFGPRPRIDRATIAWSLLWPAAWIAFTFLRGTIIDWYPYPFLDVQVIGLGAAVRDTGVVLVVAAVLLLGFAVSDRRRPTVRRAGASTAAAPTPPLPPSPPGR